MHSTYGSPCPKHSSASTGPVPVHCLLHHSSLNTLNAGHFSVVAEMSVLVAMSYRSTLFLLSSFDMCHSLTCVTQVADSAMPTMSCQLSTTSVSSSYTYTTSMNNSALAVMDTPKMIVTLQRGLPSEGVLEVLLLGQYSAYSWTTS